MWGKSFDKFKVMEYIFNVNQKVSEIDVLVAKTLFVLGIVAMQCTV